jgi:hypothetical protein
MTYAWIITRDHFAVGDTDDNDIGVIGPRGATVEQISALRAGAGRHFRMYDDDGEHYYDGRIVGVGTGRNLSDEAFGPLDDFGMPNAGCTEIRYFISGKWRSL